MLQLSFQKETKYILLFCSHKYWQSIFYLAKISLKNTYRGSFLGIVWSLLQPALQITILSIVFTHFFKFQLNNFSLYLFSGLVVWSFISGSLSRATSSLISRAQILNRTQIPKTIFPIADVLATFYMTVISLVSMQIILAIFFVGFINITVVWVPICFIPVLIFVISLSICLAYLSPYFRDLQYLVGVLFEMFYWSVPIIYPPTIIPSSIRPFFDYNPLWALIRPFQEVIYYGRAPDIKNFIISLGFSLIFSLISYLVYRKTKNHVIYYL